MIKKIIKSGKSNNIKNKYKNIEQETSVNDKIVKVKSKLELSAAEILTKNGFYFEYEPFQVPLSPPIQLCHYHASKNKLLQKCKHKSMVYTPDFIIFDQKGKWDFVIETKGIMSADFPLRMKLFKIWLAKNSPDTIYYIAQSKRDLLLVIDHIKELIRERS